MILGEFSLKVRQTWGETKVGEEKLQAKKSSTSY